jgi:BASS family bile acid:Na+ symporter
MSGGTHREAVRRDRWIHGFTNLYPVWTVLVAVAAVRQPVWFTWFDGPWILGSLTVVMLAMGLTLTFDDFKQIARIPGSVAAGFGLQYTLMPLIGWGLARALQLDTAFAVGLILVSCCPGGVASNLMTFLAGGSLALSVCLTMVSTLLAFVMTPLLTQTLAGQMVEVDALGMAKSTLQMVVAPVLAGVWLNRLFPAAVKRVARYSQVVAVLAFLLLTGGIIGANAEAVVAHLGILLAAAALLHLAGFGLGYSVARLLGYPVTIARTLAIEVGMQNGGLATVLARNHFPALPLATVSTVFSAFMQTIVGSVISIWWRLRPPPDRAGPGG